MDPPLREDDGQPMPPPGPPYLPLVATPGGRATMSVDMPICAAFIALFLVAGASHLVIFVRNKSRGHKFVFSVLLFAFCLARTAALSARVASAAHPDEARVGIVATVLLAAGVVLLYLVNLLLAQRIVRARRPDLGWRPGVTWAFRLVFVGVGVMLIMVVAATVHSFFTPDPAARAADRVVQLVASTCLAVLAFAPAPIVAAASARRPGGGWAGSERFGQGSPRTQAALVIGTSLLLALGAGFRTGVAFDVRPLSQPAWFHGRGPFYAFNYGIELIVVITYAVFRFDRRFHVPDGSAGPGDYSRAALRDGDADGEKGPAAVAAALEAAGRSIGNGDKQAAAEMEDQQQQQRRRQQQQQALEGLFELQGDALTMTDSARGTRPPTARDREKEVRGSFIEALTGPNFPATPTTTTTTDNTTTTAGGSSGSDGEGIVAAAVAAAAAMAAADVEAAVAARRSVVVAAATAAVVPRDEYGVPVDGGNDEDGQGEGREHPSPLLFRAATAYSDDPAPSALSPPTPSSAGYVTPPELGTATNDSRRHSLPPAAQWEDRARDELGRRASQDPRRRSMM